jgi:Do/DeqQ family serine protease
MRRFLSSKGLFVFNIALISIVLGFLVGVLTFSCSTRPVTGEVAYAQDRTTVSAAEALQYSFRGVAEQVLPVVVEIDVVDVVEQNVPRSPFDFFFGPRGDENPREFRSQGLGSGVLVRRDGRKVYVLTNNHVVGEAEEIEVILFDERRFEGTLVGGDERKDLALVVFETSEEVPLATLGDSDTLHVGDWALAIGNPFGLNATVTAGIISALGRRGGPGENISEFIQTDAAISPGNSGGALVGLSGEVIGINTWIASNTGASVGYGFAIPINSAKRAIDDFISTGKVQYAWLGVQIQTPNDPISEDLGIAGRGGALVSQVFRGSPAERGGIKPGDFIYRLNGQDIRDHMALTEKLGDQSPGRPAQFDLIRDGREIDLSIRLAVREDERSIAAQNKNLWPGLAVFPLTDELRSQLTDLQTRTGVIVYDVLEQTPADAAGFEQQDVVMSIGGTPIRSLREFYRALGGRTPLEFTVERAGEQITLELQ